MPRPRKIDGHPKQTQINNAIIRGTSYREIGEKYGLSKSTISNYVKGFLSQDVTKAQYERELRNGESVLAEINDIMKNLRKMVNACDEYLQDPDDPDKYYVGPRGEDIDVSYLDYTVIDEQHPVRMKKSLQELIEEVQTGKEIINTQYKFRDPRQLLLDTANAINKQLELLARIQGQIKDITINITHTTVWIEIQQIILDATKGFPEVREKIADRLRQLN